MMLCSKYQGSMLCEFRQDDFSCFPYISLCNSGNQPPCGFGQEDFLMFPYKSLCNTCGQENGSILPQGHNLNTLGKGPRGDATY